MKGDHNKPYTAMLGCKVSNLENVPEGMSGKSFEGGAYVKILAKGNLDEGMIARKWLEIWGMDLKRKYTADFELFGERAMKREEAEVDIFIAVNE